MVALIILSYIRPGLGFCVLYHVEGDDYLFIRRGRLEHSMYVNYPWSPPPYWIAPESMSLWPAAFIFAAAGFGFRFLSNCTPLDDRPGFCPQRAYNLAGNTSGVCPECGTPIKPAPARPL